MQSTFSFSTDRVPARDRYEVWQEVIARRYMLLDVEPQDPATLRADLEVHRLPATLVTFLRSTPAKYIRTRLHAQKEKGDFILIHAPATFLYYNQNEDRAFDAGDAALLFDGNTGTVVVQHPERTMTVRINGAMLRAAAGLDEGLAHRLPANNVPLRLATRYLRSVLESGPVDQALGHLVNTHVVDLLALGLRPTPETRERARAGALQAARFAVIRADILANLTESHLSAERLAARHGMSERSVYLLFEQNGLSLSRFVTEERLKRAMTMLLDPACAAMRISDIAFAVRFADLTTFNRAFRRRYGETPRDVRRRTG
jgi:AraC-like DNA-binding protein